MNQRAKGFFTSKSGSVAVSVAAVLMMLLGMTAVAVDYGHLTWVKGELTKAAEAGALAGARALVPYVGAPLIPNWIAGQNKATQTVVLNRADNQTLTDSQVEYGWWNLLTRQLDPVGTILTASHLAAVQVNIAKAAGQNGGPIQMFFAQIFGVLTRDLSARAVAVISFPTGVGPGALKPMVATKAIVDNYWNRFDPLHPDTPFQFKIGEESSDPSINDTMWSTFKVVDNSKSIQRREHNRSI